MFKDRKKKKKNRLDTGYSIQCQWQNERKTEAKSNGQKSKPCKKKPRARNELDAETKEEKTNKSTWSMINIFFTLDVWCLHWFIANIKICHFIVSLPINLLHLLLNYFFRIQYCVKCGVDWNIQFNNNFPINVHGKRFFLLLL